MLKIRDKKMMIDCRLNQYEAQSNCPVAFTYTNDQIYKMLCEFRNYSNIPSAGICV